MQNCHANQLAKCHKKVMLTLEICPGAFLLVSYITTLWPRPSSNFYCRIRLGSKNMLLVLIIVLFLMSLPALEASRVLHGSLQMQAASQVRIPHFLDSMSPLPRNGHTSPISLILWATRLAMSTPILVS